jgi:hypothetical protein
MKTTKSTLSSINLKSLLVSRINQILKKETWSKWRSKWILSWRWFKQIKISLFSLKKLLIKISKARSTLIFLKQKPNWIRKKIQLKRILWLPKLSKLLSPKTRNPFCKLMNSGLKIWKTLGSMQNSESNSELWRKMLLKKSWAKIKDRKRPKSKICFWRFYRKMVSMEMKLTTSPCSTSKEPDKVFQSVVNADSKLIAALTVSLAPWKVHILISTTWTKTMASSLPPLRLKSKKL